VAAAIRDCPRGVLARGLGRAYGDAAQNAGGCVLDCTALAGIDLDDDRGVAMVGGGVSLDALLRVTLPRGWFIPVSPGTRFVTVGGAIAADVHGKNHHVDGAIGRHIRWLDLVDGTGTVRRLSPTGQDPQTVEEFWATVGGLGLTGVITQAAIDLRRVDSAWMRVDTERAENLDRLMDRLRVIDQASRYTVAWIDVLATGRRRGRGVITSGDHADAASVVAAGHSDPLAYAPRTRLEAPPMPIGIVRRPIVRAFNEGWFRRAPRHDAGALHRIPSFFHPLDGLDRWNRLYGRQGFVQYQFAVPDGREDVVYRAIAQVQQAGAPAFLAVLKRFGDADLAPLSFARQGWTLALDIPAARPNRLAPLLDDLDRSVAEASGAVYLVKDARCRPELLPVMYPRLGAWRRVRDRLDPEHRFRSDLARRVGL